MIRLASEGVHVLSGYFKEYLRSIPCSQVTIKRIRGYAYVMTRNVTSVIGPRQIGILLLGLCMVAVGVAGLAGVI